MRISYLLFFVFVCASQISCTNNRSREPSPPIAATAIGNHRIESFALAKQKASVIHSEHPFTIYCGCRYEGKQVDLRSCGYKVHKNAKRASRLEWEHVVPAHAFGQAFAEWREGAPKCVKRGRPFKGRKCAETNPEFARMEADLYNIWPEVGELNGLRSNFSMAALGPAARNPSSISFGACTAQIADKKFEPMDMAKGIVARVYMYMDQAYPGRGIVSGKNKKLFEAWDKMFPVTKWECKRAQKIKGVQGNENQVLAQRCAGRS
jgi:deoxyribonuclease-1